MGSHGRSRKESGREDSKAPRPSCPAFPAWQRLGEGMAPPEAAPICLAHRSGGTLQAAEHWGVLGSGVSGLSPGFPSPLPRAEEVSVRAGHPPSLERVLLYRN